MLGVGAAVSADGHFHVLIAGAVLALLAMAVLLAGDPRWARVDLAVHALGAARRVASRSRRGGAARHGARRRRHHAAQPAAAPRRRSGAAGRRRVRPVARECRSRVRDPSPETRGGAEHAWDVLPRLAFFGMLFVARSGTAASRCGGDRLVAGSARPRRARGSDDTERLVVLGSIVGLFGVFLLLQLTYLFGNAPAVAGSGITFAEYARRGFNELTIVATLCALLLMALDRHAQRGSARGGGAPRGLGPRGGDAAPAGVRVPPRLALRGRVRLHHHAPVRAGLHGRDGAVLLRLAWELRAVVDPAAGPLGRRPRRAGVRRRSATGTTRRGSCGRTSSGASGQA